MEERVQRAREGGMGRAASWLEMGDTRRFLYTDGHTEGEMMEKEIFE